MLKCEGMVVLSNLGQISGHLGVFAECSSSPAENEQRFRSGAVDCYLVEIKEIRKISYPRLLLPL